MEQNPSAGVNLSELVGYISLYLEDSDCVERLCSKCRGGELLRHRQIRSLRKIAARLADANIRNQLPFRDTTLCSRSLIDDITRPLP
jgi:hypothetical protein